MSAQPQQTPGSMLEIYMHALANNTADEFLDTINLGVGNYDENEYWEQIESFQNGMYADAALSMKIIKRAREQTIRAMVDDIFAMEEHDRDEKTKLLRQVDFPEPDEGDGKMEYREKHGDDIWDNLGYSTDDGSGMNPQEHQAWCLQHVTGLDADWTPPHWRMLKARHEASRSKGAHLLDNLFGRPPEPDDMRPMEDFQ